MARSFIVIALIISALSVHAQKKSRKKGASKDDCQRLEQKIMFNMALNQQDHARQYLDSLTTCGEDNPENLLKVARNYYVVSDHANATSLFSHLANDVSMPQHVRAEAHHYLGLIAYNQRSYSEALHHAQISHDLGYNPVLSMFKIGYSYGALGMSDKAIEAYRKCLEIEPDYVYAINNIGYEYSQMHRPDLALQYHQMADSIAKGLDPVYRSNVTRAVRDLRMTEQMYELAKAAYADFPDNWLTIYDLANALAKLERYDESLALARKLRKEGAKASGDWFDLGYLYSACGLKDSAFYFYQITLRLDSNNRAALQNTGLIYKLFGEFEKAHKYLDRALALDPIHPFYIHSKASVYLWQHDYENNLRWQLKLYELYPSDENIHLGVGYAYMMAQQYDSAITRFDLHLKEKPRDDRALNNLGRCYLLKGELAKAATYLNAAVSINPENSYIYHNRAALNLLLGNQDGACSDLQTAIDKQYNWVIDSSLIELQRTHCPDVNIDRTVHIFEYTGNAKEMRGKSFISLNEVDLEALIDEEVAFLPTVAPERIRKSPNMELFPNPNNGKFQLRTSLASYENVKTNVYSADGVLVATIALKDRVQEISLPKLASGTYVLMVEDGGRLLEATMFIVER